jgi:hypothetical protein
MILVNLELIETVKGYTVVKDKPPVLAAITTRSGDVIYSTEEFSAFAGRVVAAQAARIFLIEVATR